jgi:hypothetical protein
MRIEKREAKDADSRSRPNRGRGADAGQEDEPDPGVGRFLRSAGLMLLSAVIQLGMSVLTLVHGWGLQPRSWMWIVGAGFLGTWFAKMLLVMDEHEEGAE